jgi:hypothetical protein
MPKSLQDVSDRLQPRGDFEVLRRMEGGHRNLSFLVRNATGARCVAKTTTRCEEALAWAARVQVVAAGTGMGAPSYIPGPDGRYGIAGLTLEPFADGKYARKAELTRVRAPLARLRRITEGWPQRPGFASAAGLLDNPKGGDVDLTLLPTDVADACRTAWLPLRGRRETVVHGDINTTNVLIGPTGGLVLLDWDEARCDTPLFDMTPFCETSPLLVQARLAWEVAAGWRAEPAYARALATRLLEAWS